MFRRGTLGPAGALVLTFAVVSPGAGADWPTRRHDVARTATASGTSSITEPTRYWQAYAGGSLRSDTHVAADINADGQVEIVYLAGGKAIAKLATERLVWESSPVELTRIEGVADLDGDGKLELIASSARNVFIIEGSTGKILWKEPDGEVGNVGGVRIADLDGDKNPEVLIDDCACCGISATATSTGGIYKFEAGKLSTPTRIQAPLDRTHCQSDAVTVGDFDGDGASDVAYGGANEYTMVSGRTGAVLGSTGNIGELLFYTACEAANVDGRVGDELICFQNSYQATRGGGRRVFALTYDPEATGAKVRTLWNVARTPTADVELAFVGNSLADLDGDGQRELVVSFMESAGWSTLVLDAKTGATIATIANDRVVGVIDFNGDGKPDFVTSPSSGTVVAHKFQRGTDPAVATIATLSGGYSLVNAHDFGRAARNATGPAALSIDLLGDGKRLPILLHAPPGAQPAYEAVRVDGGGASTAAATFTVPDRISILTAQVYDRVTRPYPQLLVTRNDGFLVVLDNNFAPTNAGSFGSDDFKITLPGMRVGGFVAGPIAPKLASSGGDSVVLTDSRGVLQRLDASGAWMAVGPNVVWEVKDARLASTAAALDGGKPGIVCAVRAPGATSDTLTALSGTGTTLWQHPVSGFLAGEPIAADANGDGVADVYATNISSGAVANYQVYNGATGAPLWSAPYSEAMRSGFRPFALADHDGDGAPDIYAVSNTLRVLSGATGSTLASNPTFLGYFTPTILDVDGDGVPEVTLSGGFYPARTLKKDLTTTLWIGEDDRPFQHGARAACGSRSVWVQPSTQVQGMLRLITMSGPDAGKAKTLYLAGGAAFASSAAATTAGKFLGTLGSPAVKQDLLGTGAHPSVLVGSSDGFLYALNPCGEGTVDWAFDLGIAVGDPILADTSGDGVDEILVGAADGYLHAIGQRVLAAPAFVDDEDPVKLAATGTGPDVDVVATVDTLGASWAAVDGADGYQLAVLTATGAFVTPSWLYVGNTLSTTVKGLPLIPGSRYVVAIRAVSRTKGSSLETRSDGVLIEAPGPGPVDGGTDDVGVNEDAGTAGVGEVAGGGCGCRVDRGSAAVPGGMLSVLAVAAVLGRLRRRPRA